MHLSDHDSGAPPERDGLPIIPIVIGLVVVGLVAAAAFQVLGMRPVGSAKINSINAIELPSKDRVAVEIDLSVQNTTDKPLRYHSLDVKLVTPQETFKDEPASIVEVPRIYGAYPALRQAKSEPLKGDTVLTPGATVNGAVILAFPVTKQAFESRKSLEVTVFFYDESPIHVKQ
jgi:hypothetical protein